MFQNSLECDEECTLPTWHGRHGPFSPEVIVIVTYLFLTAQLIYCRGLKFETRPHMCESIS